MPSTSCRQAPDATLRRPFDLFRCRRRGSTRRTSGSSPETPIRTAVRWLWTSGDTVRPHHVREARSAPSRALHVLHRFRRCRRLAPQYRGAFRPGTPGIAHMSKSLFRRIGERCCSSGRPTPRVIRAREHHTASARNSPVTVRILLSDGTVSEAPIAVCGRDLVVPHLGAAHPCPQIRGDHRISTRISTPGRWAAPKSDGKVDAVITRNQHRRGAPCPSLSSSSPTRSSSWPS